MPAEVGTTKLFFGPTEFGAPDALLTPIVDTILLARETVVLATQQLNDPDIVSALAIARRHGVRVRVLLERDYLREAPPLDQIWLSGGSREASRAALAALYRAGIDVRVEGRSPLMHENFVVADHGSDTATVVSTSANLSAAGIHRNLNHLLVMRDHRVAATFMNEFESLWNGKVESSHPRVPIRINGDQLAITVVFGPDQDPEGQLTKLIEQAKRTVLFSISSFSTGSTIDNALCRASQRGVQVFGLFDRSQALQRWAVTDALERAGILVHVTEDLLRAMLHHKLMVLDDTTICLGTFNYSVAAARANEEVLVIVEPQRAFSGRTLPDYAKREILRIQRKFSHSASRLLSG